MEQTVVVELKNDLSVQGTLKSVDQFLNIKLDDISVLEEVKYPHLVCKAGVFLGRGEGSDFCGEGGFGDLWGDGGGGGWKRRRPGCNWAFIWIWKGNADIERR